MTETKSELAELIRAVQLKGVRLIEGIAKTSIRSPREVGKVRLNINSGAKAGERSGDDFYVTAFMEAQVVQEDRPAEKPVVDVRAVFELLYSVPCQVTTSKKTLGEFAELNGVFNAWPFGREFIQSMSVRMNLPPIVAPVFRIGDAVRATPAKDLAEPPHPRRREKIDAR